MHPLALLNVSDDTYQTKLTNNSSSLHILGFVLGVIHDGTNSIVMAIEMNEHMESKDIEAKLEILGKVYGYLKLVGFYTVGTQFQENLEFFYQLGQDIQKLGEDKVGKLDDLVYITFESKEFEYEVYRLSDDSQINDLKTATSTMENIALNDIIQARKPINSGNSKGNMVEDTCKEMRTSLDVLGQKLNAMIEFLESIQKGDRTIYGEGDEKDYETLKMISRIIGKLERIGEYKRADDGSKITRLALIEQSLLLENIRRIHALSNIP